MRSDGYRRYKAVNDGSQRAQEVIATPTSSIAVAEVSVPSTRQVPGSLSAWRVTKILIFMEDRLNCVMTTQSMAAHVGMSASYFFRAFKLSLGDSPHRYLMARRVAHACQLLVTSDLGLAQIATDCGLADQAHLTKLFRRFLGNSPGAWRRANAAKQTEYSQRLQRRRMDQVRTM
jgi:AraC family transcriptional regulator